MFPDLHNNITSTVIHTSYNSFSTCSINCNSNLYCTTDCDLTLPPIVTPHDDNRYELPHRDTIQDSAIGAAGKSGFTCINGRGRSSFVHMFDFEIIVFYEKLSKYHLESNNSYCFGIYRYKSCSNIIQIIILLQIAMTIVSMIRINNNIVILITLYS